MLQFPVMSTSEQVQVQWLRLTRYSHRYQDLPAAPLCFCCEVYVQYRVLERAHHRGVKSGEDLLYMRLCRAGDRGIPTTSHHQSLCDGSRSYKDQSYTYK